MTSSGDLSAGVASFCIPGLGQLLSGNASRGLVMAVLGFLAWAGPGLAVGLHFLLSGELDSVARAEADEAMAPFAWLLRIAVHVGAAYDAGSGPVRPLPKQRRAVPRGRRRPRPRGPRA